MPGIWGSIDDDQPQGGLLAGLQRGITNPLTLGGFALLSGEGWNGAMQGMQMGSQFEQQRRQQEEQDRFGAATRQFLSDPKNLAQLPPGMGQLVQAMGPRGLPIAADAIAKSYVSPLELQMKQAELAKTKAETNALGQKDVMANAILTMIGGGTAGPGAGAPGTPAPGLPQPLPQSYQPPPNAGPRLLPISDPTMPSAAPGPGTQPQAGSQPFPSPDFSQGLLRVADGPTPNGAPPGPPQGPPAAPPQNMINTPYGPMDREKAMKLGGAMLLDPRYAAAGKALVDQAQGSTAPELSKPAIGALQEKQLNTVEQLTRLKSIKQSWKPEYQQIETRMGFAWNNLLDKFGSTRKSLTPAQRQDLAAYSANRAESLNNLNQYIKEITGAAMTVAEADRIRKSQANPGEGIFDGDSPTEFDAKMRTNIRMSEMALARYSYLTKQGYPANADELAKAIPLEQMPRVIQQRTEQLQKSALEQNPGMSPQDVAPIVRQRLRSEFGLDT